MCAVHVCMCACVDVCVYPYLWCLSGEATDNIRCYGDTRDTAVPRECMCTHKHMNSLSYDIKHSTNVGMLVALWTCPCIVSSYTDTAAAMNEYTLLYRDYSCLTRTLPSFPYLAVLNATESAGYVGPRNEARGLAALIEVHVWPWAIPRVLPSFWLQSKS